MSNSCLKYKLGCYLLYEESTIMFAQPSKKVPSGEFDLSVRFLVPPHVIYEALTDGKAAQVWVPKMYNWLVLHTICLLR